MRPGRLAARIRSSPKDIPYLPCFALTRLREFVRSPLPRQGSRGTAGKRPCYGHGNVNDWSPP